METKNGEDYKKNEKCEMCGQTAFGIKMKLRYPLCGHNICSACFKKVFSTVQVSPCIKCKKELTRKDYEKIPQDEVIYQKEIRFRKVYVEASKRREDFGDTLSYNDYLERCEDDIQNYLKGANFDSFIKDAKAKPEIGKNNAKREMEERKIIEEIKIQEGKLCVARTGIDPSAIKNEKMNTEKENKEKAIAFPFSNLANLYARLEKAIALPLNKNQKATYEELKRTKEGLGKIYLAGGYSLEYIDLMYKKEAEESLKARLPITQTPLLLPSPGPSLISASKKSM